MSGVATAAQTAGHRGASWAAPVAIGLFSFGLYAVTLQHAIYGDGINFVDLLADGKLLNHRILVLPLARLVQLTVGLVVEVDGETALKLLSAFAGSIGAGFAFCVARRLFSSSTAATACAALTAVLPGCWFFATSTEIHTLHATCSWLLLWGLLRSCAGPIGSTTGLMLFAGSALTPVSHLSGVAAALPVAFVAWQKPECRKAILVWSGAGFVAAGCVYLWLHLFDDSFSRYRRVFRSYGHLDLLSDPAFLWRQLQTSAHEMLKYACPASTLLFAGVRVLVKQRPLIGWLLVSWLLAWTLIVMPIEVRELGGYYVPVLLAQAAFAIAAMRRLARSWPWALLAATLATAPGVAWQWGEAVGWTVFIVAAALLLGLTGRFDTRPSRRYDLVLPLFACALFASVQLSSLSEDPVRDRLVAVSTYAEPDSVLLMLSRSEYHHWLQFEPMRSHRAMAVNVRDLRRDLSADYISVLRHRVGAGGRVYLVGSSDDLPPPIADLLDDAFRLRVPPDAPDGLLVLDLKD